MALEFDVEVCAREIQSRPPGSPLRVFHIWAVGNHLFIVCYTELSGEDWTHLSKQREISNPKQFDRLQKFASPRPGMILL